MAGVTLLRRRPSDAELRRAECDDLRQRAMDLIRHSAAMWGAVTRVQRAALSLANAEARGDQEAIARHECEQGAALEDFHATDADARTTLAVVRLSHPSVSVKAEALWRASRVPRTCGSTDDTTRRKAETEFSSRVWARLDVLEA